MTSERRYHLLGAGILLAGLLAATAVYLRTTPEGDGEVGADGTVYSLKLEDSKRSERQIEQISGKPGVLAAEFMDGFEGLWQGRNLAYTLAVLSVGGSLTCLFLAHFQILGPPADPNDKPRA
jgi:hypothetical protein